MVVTLRRARGAFAERAIARGHNPVFPPSARATRRRFGQRIPMSDLAATAPVALLVMAMFVGASLLALFAAPGMIERGVFRPYWLLRRNQWATLVTSAFLHADIGHLFFNGFTFWAFGFSLERTIGSAQFALLYAFGLLASALGTWVAHRLEPEYRTLGASGAILAVLFASIVYHPSSSILILPFPMPIPAPLFAVLYLAFTWWASRQARGRINHDGHLAGALAGVAFVALTNPPVLSRAISRLLG
jgi:membrane associated rhomboid family serine protease